MKRTPIRRIGWTRRRNKFNAVPVHDSKTGNSFDSTGEFQRYGFLQMLQLGGVIKCLALHPVVTLIPRTTHGKELTWKLDYMYIQDGRMVYEDYKPRPFTDADRLKMKLWQHFGKDLLIITHTVKGAVRKRIIGGGEIVI